MQHWVKKSRIAKKEQLEEFLQTISVNADQLFALIRTACEHDPQCPDEYAALVNVFAEECKSLTDAKQWTRIVVKAASELPLAALYRALDLDFKEQRQHTAKLTDTATNIEHRIEHKLAISDQAKSSLVSLLSDQIK